MSTIRRKYIYAAPILVFLALILVFLGFGVNEPVFEPPYLILVLNTLFLTISSLVVATLSARSYLNGAKSNILILGCAFLINGVAAAVAGWFSFSVNYTVTIYNTCTLFSALFQLVNAAFSPQTLGLEAKKTGLKLKLTAFYTASIAIIAIVTAFAYYDLLPKFFTDGLGATLLGKSILVLSILFFATSSILLLHRQLKSKSRVLFWYSLGLALFAIGLFGVSSEMSLGDPIGWTGKIAQYTGGLYFLVAVIVASKASAGTDISEKWAEAFGSDRLQLENLFSNMLNGFSYQRIIIKDGVPADYVFLAVNQAFEKMTGLKAGDVIGKRVTEVLPGIEKDPADWIGIYGKVGLTGQPITFENYVEILKKWYSVSAYSPKKGYFVSIFEDISERKKAEEKLDEYSKNLEKLVEVRTKELKDAERLAAIGATAGMVGHDIRNPLQAITSDIFLLKSELDSMPDSEEKHFMNESLEGIESNVDYINKIVQDLQDYARPLNPKGEKSDLRQIIENLLSKSDLPKNINVKLEIADDARIVIADSYYLNRILFNLITNAVQAMPNRGKLTIKTYREANNIIIAVQDTGVGIPDDIKGKMFTLMFTTKAKGQGFGLPVVKRMIESLGGTVTFESEVGKGTKFILTVPQ